MRTIAAEAKKRQQDAGVEHGRGQEKVPEKSPEPKTDKGDARDKAAKTVRQKIAEASPDERKSDHKLGEVFGSRKSPPPLLTTDCPIPTRRLFRVIPKLSPFLCFANLLLTEKARRHF